MGRAFFASTSGIDPAQRIEFWNSGSSRIGGVQTEAMSDAFDAQITFRRLDCLSVFHLTSTPHQVTMNALDAGNGRMLRLRYQQTGNSLVFQGQRSIKLRPGDWMIFNPHQPHAAVNKGNVSHLWLQIPCDSLTTEEVATALSMQPYLPMERKMGGALRECLDHAVETPGEISSQAELDLARTMTGMLRGALRQLPQGPVHSTSREATARRAREYIDRHLHDPDLSVEQVARALGCTPRYVHKAFEGSESVSRYIWNRRLDMCRNRLERRPTEAPTLTALAFDFGFNSSSHFSRSFRERFGTSPSSFLASVQQAHS
jgi:AraC-like DNA-binding protein